MSVCIENTWLQNGPGVWYGPDVEKRQGEWLFRIAKEELQELLCASETLIKSSPSEKFLCLDTLDDLNKFHLPLIRTKVAQFVNCLKFGLGFVVWRGIPVESWSRKQVCASFLILGKCMGELRQQNAQGHVLGHVCDRGLPPTDPTVRPHQTRERLTFHSDLDLADVVGLLCLKTAKSGGLSSVVSSQTLFNEMLGRNPILAEELTKPMPKDKRVEVEPGTKTFFYVPVYCKYESKMTADYQRMYINSSQNYPDAPRLTKLQTSALDMLDQLADDPALKFSMEFKPGDVQFVYNRSILHNRTEFVDWTEPELKRHLLRVWVATPSARPLHSGLEERFMNAKHVVSVAPISPLGVKLL